MSAIERPSDDFNGLLTDDPDTHYIGVGGDASMIHSIHLAWDAALTATITVESCNFPEVAVDDETAGNWIDEADITDISPAASASGAMIHIADNGARRLRLKVVVTEGGAGRLRVRQHGKQ